MNSAPTLAESLASAELSTGRIEVEVHRSSMTPGRLFGFAERRNPKRAFLFVSNVLGRHVPVAPSVAAAAMQDLAGLLPHDLPGPVLVVGMAETAIALGAGVHRAYAAQRDDAVFLATTRHALGLPLLGSFHEEHSHATLHLLHEPADAETARMVRQARSVVLVDDEMSTGRTLVNLARALEAAGLDQVQRIVLAVLTDWSGQAVQALGPRASAVSLLSGRYTWTARGGAEPLPMPSAAVRSGKPRLPDTALDWGRLGVQRHHARLAPRIHAQPGEAILVLGTGEHVWQPFLLAEALERQGATVRFGATTRSPIAVGHAIGSAIAFSDNHGSGVAHYLYNVDPGAYDRIVLCCETPAASVDPRLLEALRWPDVLSDVSTC